MGRGPLVALEHGSGQLVALEHGSEAETELALAHCGAVMGGSVPCEIANPPSFLYWRYPEAAVSLPHDYLGISMSWNMYLKLDKCTPIYVVSKSLPIIPILQSTLLFPCIITNNLREE